MESVSVIDLGEKERHGYVIGTLCPLSDPAYSPNLDVGYNNQNFSWKDNLSHIHTESEEYFIVLKGRIDMLVNQSVISIGPGELLGVRSGISHQIINVIPPIENFLLRFPGGGNDKIFPDNVNSSHLSIPEPKKEVIRLNMHQNFYEYPIGACLPLDHPNYSPLFDFTCVWGVDPCFEWKNEISHFHAFREEYYFVLKGELDFMIDGSIISVTERQILGVRPKTIHRVVGGHGPVDVLFVRVPGGRGDKIIPSVISSDIM